MIDFVILNNEQPDATLLETVRIIVGYDMKSAYYDAEAQTYTPEQVEGLWRKATKMRDENGNAVMVAPLGMSEKVKEAPDCVPGFMRTYFGHPISELVRMQIARATVS